MSCSISSSLAISRPTSHDDVSCVLHMLDHSTKSSGVEFACLLLSGVAFGLINAPTFRRLYRNVS